MMSSAAVVGARSRAVAAARLGQRFTAFPEAAAASSSARAASTSSSGLDRLQPHLRNSAGASRERPYLSHVETVRAAQLLAARVHLGHQKSRLHRRNTGQIEGFRHNIAVYDINKTWRSMRTLFYAFAEMASQRASFFLLAPNETLPLGPVIEAMRKQYPFRHDRFGSLYMTGYADKKWMDGLFSNWKVVHSFAQATRTAQEGKPGSRRLRNMRRTLKGIEDADLYAKIIPDFMLVLATDRGALHEARNADVPLFGIVDTNTDPEPFLYPVFANDDSVESVQFVLDLVKRGVEEGRKREQEAFALLMVRKLKQALDPNRGTSFGLVELAGQEADAAATGERPEPDAWAPRPAIQAERPAWYNKVDLTKGNVKLDSVAAGRR